MADAQEYAKTQPEVELDTDDVKETDVKVEETKEESKEPNLNAGEVDLGYTEHDKDQSKEEVAVEEVQEEPQQQETKQQSEPEDLTEVSESVRKRIDKLTRKFREAERREKAALDFAKGLQKKYEDTQTKYDSTDEKYLKELDARVDAQREQVKRKLKEAIENNDADKIMEANDELTQLTVEKEKARIKMADREARLKQLEAQNLLLHSFGYVSETFMPAGTTASPGLASAGTRTSLTFCSPSASNSVAKIIASDV